VARRFSLEEFGLNPEVTVVVEADFVTLCGVALWDSCAPGLSVGGCILSRFGEGKGGSLVRL